MEKKFKEHVSERGTWVRLFYMAVFVVIFNVAELAIAVVAVVQFLLKLATGEVHERLRTLGGTLGTYVHQIIAFLTFHGEDMPYPFGEWPDAEAEAAAPEKTPARRKGAGKDK